MMRRRDERSAATQNEMKDETGALRVSREIFYKNKYFHFNGKKGFKI